MKAIVVKPFSGVPDGKVYAEDFQLNDVVDGLLASVALAQGWAVPEGGKVPADPVTLRAKAEAEIELINTELEKRRNTAALEVEEINDGVVSARNASIATLAVIDNQVLEARGAADTELIKIKSEVEDARQAAAAEIEALAIASLEGAKTGSDENDRPKTKPKLDKE